MSVPDIVLCPICVAHTGGWTASQQLYTGRVISAGGAGWTPFKPSLSTSTGGSYTYSVSSGALPTGLSISSTTGKVSGTVTASAGVYSFQITITNSTIGYSATGSFSFLVFGSAPSGNYYFLCASDFTTLVVSQQCALPFFYFSPGNVLKSVTNLDQLPPGLSLYRDPANAALFYLIGTPTTAGYYSFRIQTTDNDNTTAVQMVTLQVMSTQNYWMSIPPAIVGAAYSFTFNQVFFDSAYQQMGNYGSFAPYSVSSYASISSGGHSISGLSLSSSGALSGTPGSFTAGDSIFRISFTITGTSHSVTYAPYTTPPATPGSLNIQQIAMFSTAPPTVVIPPAWLTTYELSGSPLTGGYVDRSSYLFLEGSQHSISQQIRQRGKASYTLFVAAGDSYAPTQWEPVFLFDQRNDGTWFLQFAGVVQDFKNRWINGTAGDHFVDVNAVSLEALFDQQTVETPMQFVNQTCGYIVTALFNAFMTGSFVTLGTIQAGATVPLFNAKKGDSLSSIFGQLATTSLFTWNVRLPDVTLFFGLPTANAAPYTLTNTGALWGTINEMFDGADYRNRQAVRLSLDAFPHSEEFFTGSGQQSFTLMRPVNQVVAAYITLSTCNTATITFTGQPSAGDTITIAPYSGGWQASHIYSLGGVITYQGYVFKVTTAGTSGATIPSGFATQTVTGDTVTDNSVIWTCEGPTGISTGTTTYTFVSGALTGYSGTTGVYPVSSANPSGQLPNNAQYGLVVIQSTLAATIQALVDAINANQSTRGSTFSLPTWENSQCNAISVTGTTFVLQQKAAGSGWVASIAISSSAFSGPAVTSGGSSPQGSVGPNEPATISIQVYQQGTSTAAPGLAYTEGSAVVTLATPLNSGTNLNVEYTRADGDIIEVEDTTLVNALALVTNGTGKVQRVTDQSSTGVISTSTGAGLQLAQQALAAFSPIPTAIEVGFLQPGIQAGQAWTINLGGALGTAINGTYYVEELSGEMIPAQPYLDPASAPNAGHYRYTAKLINVAQIGSYMDFWEGLGGGGSGGSGTGGALVATSGGAQATQGSAAGLPSGAVAASGTLSSGQLLIGGGGTTAESLPTATTGAGSAALGANCPATTATAPYTWLEVTAPDGSTVYIPVWK